MSTKSSAPGSGNKVPKKKVKLDEDDDNDGDEEEKEVTEEKTSREESV